LKALNVLLKGCSKTLRSNPGPEDVSEQVIDALHIALNDYTVTERGDVGALVRLEALNTTATGWSTGLIKSTSPDGRLHANVLRLSLEKLDKIRGRAAHVLEQGSLEHLEIKVKGEADGVSSYIYFATALTFLQSSTPSVLREALMLGFVSSAGMGSESVVQNSRAALLDVIDLLPEDANKVTSEYTLLDMANCFVDLLKRYLDTERILLPLLEIIAFLFDMQVMPRLVSTNFRLVIPTTRKN
jgi:tubulin-specific chaperone D